MTDVEISKALALAIGWPHVQVLSKLGCVVRDNSECVWKAFDHRDWRVAAPVAERYNCFPKKSSFAGTHLAWIATVSGKATEYAETPQGAIARAVIKAHASPKGEPSEYRHDPKIKW